MSLTQSDVNLPLDKAQDFGAKLPGLLENFFKVKGKRCSGYFYVLNRCPFVLCIY
jgi:hypothetical protein